MIPLKAERSPLPTIPPPATGSELSAEGYVPETILRRVEVTRIPGRVATAAICLRRVPVKKVSNSHRHPGVPQRAPLIAPERIGDLAIDDESIMHLEWISIRIRIIK